MSSVEKRGTKQDNICVIKFISFILYFKWNYFNNKLFLVLTTNSIIFVTHSSSLFFFKFILFTFTAAAFDLFSSFLFCWIIHCIFIINLSLHFFFFAFLLLLLIFYYLLWVILFFIVTKIYYVQLFFTSICRQTLTSMHGRREKNSLTRKNK